MTHRERQLGFALTELMIALALLTIFAAAATKLLSGSLRLMWQAEAQHNRMMQTERILQSLRQDVWNARRVEKVEGGIRIVQRSQQVIWLSEDETIERSVEFEAPVTTQPSPERWTIPKWKLSLEPSPAGVIVSADDQSSGNSSEELILVSQLQLLKEAMP